MPAYRSEAEAEIREAVVARIRLLRPQHRVIHEINVAGQGTNRIDVLAIGEEEILAVEIKSAKDKIDRLPGQVKAMRGVAHHVIAALHEKFLVPSRWSEGRVEAPESAYGATVWAYPEKEEGRCYDCRLWAAVPNTSERAVPWDALHMLWRDELFDLCGALRIPVGRRATMSDMLAALRWHCTGKELTRGICATLRARRCVEADPEISEKLAA